MHPKALLFLLPLLVNAAKHCKPKNETAAPSAPLNQALVATGSRGRWDGRPTTTPTDIEPIETEVPQDDDEDAAATSLAPASSNLAAYETPSVLVDPIRPSSVAASPSPSSTGGNTTSAASGDCSCGYILSAYDDAYFPQSLIIDFATVTDKSTLAGMGLRIMDGSKAGSVAPDGGRSLTSIDNVAITDGVLTLTVPGGQAKGGQIGSAEIETIFAATGGVFTMNAQLSPVAGTCQSIFTYTENEDVGLDEQDIEVVAITPGKIQLTNHDPAKSKENELAIVPFPNDPFTSFNDYTIGWYKDSTKYYYNGAVLDGPTQYRSVNPSQIVINNWSSGKETFTQGPPVEDTVLQIKSIAYYYQEESMSAYPAYPAGCSEAQACRV
ncbi:uncharacterized protein I303_106793 [Kwoniella dejecticola CBS 10117]|uniref:GH16 domain-containing protein n=1 Tax=Kwoniella dejecticola CBS 10117 TaxID=1296121 RepID=A0A1A5ZTS6_9TREE|nr:uncharacterized protein I303_08565 [Kwoniella dejecticola CBS 10117]OBR81180.1 hypothetical protein I303_08565 [Kwoniella dejecticola CBS 10117]